MKAFVLAAGFGVRMLPVTRYYSKVCLPLAGVPGIVRVIRELRRCGADDFIVNLHHGADYVRHCLDACGETPFYSPENEILGTAGALARAAEFLDGGTFLLVNGDCSYEGIPLAAALEFHRAKGALATIVLLDMPENAHYGAVEVDRGGRVVRIAGRPEGAISGERSLHFCGIHLIEPELLSRVRPVFSDIIRDIYVPLIAEGAPVYGFHTAFGWRDLGTPERYLEASFEFLRRGINTRNSSVIDGSCMLEPGSVIGPLADLGCGVRVGRGSSVARSVLCDNVNVGDGCLIEDCVLAPGTKVVDRKAFRKSLLAPGEHGLEVREW